ncbi:MAG TPA: chromosomal replication initiator protein DnaA [Desulfobacteraceae bacterium]|nr:chromosomal replication initiator protein DnaA [Desulfobacteraceae bacterium]HPJ67404.1 chromosomal replication initiator protein DnaA [Desulfobacteraceae bacterium]HPQ29253.1 chromosomal replication initiator protein DnaA [Desulfobacteraceae bacterium]
MFKKNEIWSKIVSNIKSDVSQPQLSSWLFNSSLKNLDRNLAVIEVPNKFFATWLTDNCISRIQDSLNENLNFLPEIRFTYRKVKTNQQLSPFIQNKVKREDLISNNLNPSWTFNEFITDNSNKFAYSSSKKVSNQPGTYYNPLYIYCKYSFGKTHLLHAIGNKIITDNPKVKVKYYTAEQFYSDFSFCIRKQNLTGFKEQYKNLDYLLLDDIQFFSGRVKIQKELVNLFNTLYESKKQMVFAGRDHPVDMHNLLPQLRSRFEGGVLSEILVPDQSTKIEIIKAKSKREVIDIPDDVVFFLANTTDDFKNLNQYFASIKNYISIYNRSIDISIIKSIINTKNFNEININDIQKLTAEYFNLSVNDLFSNNKKRNFSYPRHIAMYLSRILTKSSFKEIAKAFGNMNHSTIIYAVKKIEKEKEENNQLLVDINNLYALIS